MVSEARPAEGLTAGQVLDGFRVEQQLHQGGMATIWQVRRSGHDAGEAERQSSAELCELGNRGLD